MLKKLGALCLATVAVATLGACSLRAPADYVVLYYQAGAGENKKFKECIQPGEAGDQPYDDQAFYLPTSLRTFKVEPGSADHDGTFNVGSAPDEKGQAGPQMAIRTTVDFYLNTFCGKDGKDAGSPVVQFWEKTGRRYGVSTDGDDESAFQVDKWLEVLRNTLLPVQDGLLQAEARKYDDDALDTNAGDIWAAMEKSISTKFNEQLRAKVGGDYFCGTGYDRTDPKCPDVFVDILGIDYKDQSIQNARNEVRVAEEQAKAELVRARAELEKANLLAAANRNPNYLAFAQLEAQVEIARLNLEAARACSANPNCTVIVGAPQNLGVNTGK